MEYSTQEVYEQENLHLSPFFAQSVQHRKTSKQFVCDEHVSCIITSFLVKLENVKLEIRNIGCVFFCMDWIFWYFTLIVENLPALFVGARWLQIRYGLKIIKIWQLALNIIFNFSLNILEYGWNTEPTRGNTNNSVCHSQSYIHCTCMCVQVQAEISIVCLFMRKLILPVQTVQSLFSYMLPYTAGPPFGVAGWLHVL